jgi:hypothetical protein
MKYPNFWWFGQETVDALRKDLMEHEGENVRLKVIPVMDEKDQELPPLLLQVEDVRTKDCGECLNESHTCPPDC